jgi:hypothetical protein
VKELRGPNQRNPQAPLLNFFLLLKVDLTVLLLHKPRVHESGTQSGFGLCTSTGTRFNQYLKSHLQKMDFSPTKDLLYTLRTPVFFINSLRVGAGLLQSDFILSSGYFLAFEVLASNFLL